MKNIFKEMRDRLRCKCDSLSPTQRKRVLIFLCVIYLIATMIVLADIFIPDRWKGNKDEFERLINDDIYQDTLAMPVLIPEETLNTENYE